MKYKIYFKYWTNKTKTTLVECFVSNEDKQIGYSSIECKNCFNRVRTRKQLIAKAIKFEMKETRKSIWEDLFKSKMRICG